MSRSIMARPGCLGIHAATRGTRCEALQPIRQGVREGFGAIGKDLAAGPIVRHDKGSQYIGHDFQNEGARLGATASPSFVRAPAGKGGAERCIRTSKETLLWDRALRHHPASSSRTTTSSPGRSSARGRDRRTGPDARPWTKSLTPHRLRRGLDNPRALQPRGATLRDRGHRPLDAMKTGQKAQQDI